MAFQKPRRAHSLSLRAVEVDQVPLVEFGTCAFQVEPGLLYVKEG